MTTDNAEERAWRKTRLYLSRRYDGKLSRHCSYVSFDRAAHSCNCAAEERVRRGRTACPSDFEWLAGFTAGRFLICLSPSTPLLARVDSSDRSRVEHEQRGVQEDGVWVQRPICLS
jgi:hypothetical protein